MQYIIMIATLLILVVNILFGIKRGVYRGLLRLGTLLLAAVAAFFLAKGLSASIAEMIVPVVEEALAASEEFSAFLAENPVVGQSVGMIAQMLVAPLLFLLCYMVLKVITWVAYFILRLVFHIKKPKGLLLRVVGGAATGFCVGLIGVLVFVTPVMGYTNLFSRTATEAASLAESLSLDEYNEQYLAPASEAPVAAALYNGIGSKLFAGLTTAELDGAETNLEAEWFSVIGVVNQASKLGGKPVAEYGEAESAAVHAMAAGVGESKLLSAIGGGAMNGIASAWLDGQTFMGVGKPETGDESVDIILNGFLRVLATTNPELISGDLECFADLFDLFIKHGVFSKISGDGSTDALVTHLATSGFLEDARKLLTENARMEPVVNAISDAGMRLLIRELGDPSTYLEEHKELLDNISSVLQDAVDDSGKIDTAALATGMQEKLAEKEIEVPAEATEIIAEGLADEFTPEELGNLSVEEITDRLIDRFGTVENISQIASAAQGVA